MNRRKSNILSEPEVIYKPKSQVAIFNSFEEMNEADAREMAAISPLEHLQNATMLIKKIYAEEIKNPMDKTIKFE